ncbi:RNase adapter RapZ [Algiphilus sp. W345]|uniref:RNase adapter RapZ n=1 Tax=Banduia mediterranea TaxID=3075609 RepID=A0ABU2WKJ1_9GAMM|nr:RNase adapter RapZ [Algiphilus sp. W345]MDT0498392.1 RNase adapter RapZ [Algiphilus sp. W345]
MELVIVSGLSGAGKSVALRQYEDMGHFCIDNLPLALVAHLSQHTAVTLRDRYERLAIGIDARESPEEIAQFPVYLDQLRGIDIEAQVIFLTASDESLRRRYNETRRRHPLSGADTPLNEAIRLERRLLSPIANLAHLTLDTTDMNVHQLRETIQLRSPGVPGRMVLTFESFGFKNGVPDGLDFVFDVRCLPNPHWEPGLRALSGRDQPVADYLAAQDEVQRMLGDIQGFLESWLPSFDAQDRSYLTVGIGCTGGQHRSVFIVERLAQLMRDRFDPIIVRHRETHR